MLGQYELVGRIAMGGMAEILRARQKSEAGFEKDVVIKRILPQFIDDMDFIRMFQDEAVLAAKLSHPNIVQVFDFKNVDGAYFIAMEYVEGVDLRRLIQYGAKIGKPIGANRAVQVALAIARGLGHAHERMSGGVPLKIVHRDVSPHNVLVSLSGDVKVMDFGIAKAAARVVRTSTGILKGKVGYMSPEQALGDPAIDHRSDIYATGVVLWEMLANERLFQGDSELEVLARVQRGDATPIRQVCPDILPELEACVTKFLARDKDDRYQRMRDAERDLGPILTKLGGREAAPLEDYAAEVIPRDVIDALRGLVVPDVTKELKKERSLGSEETSPVEGSQPKDAAATQVFEATNPERFSHHQETISGSTMPPPPTVSVTVNGRSTPTNAKGAKRIVMVAVALGIAVIAGAALIDALMMTKPVAIAAPETAYRSEVPPSPVQVAPPPLPAPQPTFAPPEPSQPLPAPQPSGTKAPAVKAEGAVKKTRSPEAARQGEPRLELQDCPLGAIVYEGSRALGAISARNRDSFPVLAGARVYSIRTAQGSAVAGPTRINLADGEMDTLRCR